MKTAVSMIALGIALAATCSNPIAVHAEEAAPAPAVALTLEGAPLPADLLEEQRGGADAHLSNIRAIGSVDDVQVIDAMTGSNLVTEGALAGTAGVPMLIQNSGNGVLIQNAVIINVEVK